MLTEQVFMHEGIAVVAMVGVRESRKCLKPMLQAGGGLKHKPQVW